LEDNSLPFFELISGVAEKKNHPLNRL